MAKRVLVALLSTPAALIGCHGTEPDLPDDPPTSVTEVTTGGFQSPTDAVASPDGRMLYFAAWDMDQPNSAEGPEGDHDGAAVGGPALPPWPPVEAPPEAGRRRRWRKG